MTQEENDKVLYDVVCTIWEAYRESTKSSNASHFNHAFTPLFEKYKDDCYKEFILQLGGCFAPFINKACARKKE